MTTIGYATLQIIPSLEGVSASIDKQLGGKLSLSGKKAGADFGKGLGSGLASAQRNVDQFATAYRKAFDKAADAAGKLRTAEAQLKQVRSSGNESRIVAAEERYAKALRDSNRAADDAKGAHRALSSARDALSGLNKESGNAAGGIGLLGSKLSDLAPAAGALVGGAIAAGVAGIGAAAVVVTKQLFDLGAVFDDVSDNLRIKTGASGADLEALKDVVDDIARSTPVSIGAIGGVVAEVRRNLHLTGADLEAVSKTITNLNRITGEQTNMRDLGKAFRAFGVEAKDQSAALDSLFSVTQRTGLSVNDMIEAVVKGGPALRQFGLDFGQSAGLVALFEDAGLDADKAMTGLNKGLTELAKNGKTGPQALRDTVTEIQNLIRSGNQAGAIDLASKLFGGRGAGQSFFEAIKNGQLDLQQLASSLDNTGESINAVAADTDDWSEHWQTLKNNIALALKPIATKVFDLASSGLEDLSQWVSTHQADIIGFFSGLLDAVGGFTQFTLKAIGLTLEGFGQLAGGVGNLAGVILRAQAAMSRLFGDETGAAAADAQADSMFGLGEGLQEAGRKAQEAAEDLGNLRQRMREAAAEAKIAAELTDALGSSVQALPDGKDIKLNHNIPEVNEKLRKLGFEIQTLPDGTVRIVARTDEAKRIADAWRKQQEADPVNVEVIPKIDGQALLNAISGGLKQPVPIPVTPEWKIGPAGLGPPLPLPQIPPRARGGIFDVWNEVASFAGGKLPRQAMIQPPVGGAGLVQWAEPSTRGEAFIPLGAANRDRSLAIWAETGRRLGAFASFATGGLTRDMLDQIAVSQFGLQLGSGDRNEPGSYHGIHGGARDYNGDPARLEQFANWLAANLGPYLDELIFQSPTFTQTIKDGQVKGPFGAFYTEAQAGHHRDHVHVAFGKHAAMFQGLQGRAPGGNISPLGSLTTASGTNDVASAIIGEAQRRGFTREQTIAVLSTALQESGLNPKASGGGGAWHGIFQQDTSYPGRDNPNTNIGEFFNRLGAPGSDIWKQIFALQQGTPFESGRQGYLTEIQSQKSKATQLFDSLAQTTTSVDQFRDSIDSTTESVDAADTPPSGPSSASSTTSSSFSLPSSIPELSGFGLDSLGAGIGTTSSGSDLSLFGKAAGAAVSGQVSSALGVFGVPDSPGWLKGLSMLIGGIKIGGGDGAALPISASPMRTPDDPGNMHSGSGQAPGPQTINNWTINARDTEDAFIRAQRIEREKAAAKLNRF